MSISYHDIQAFLYREARLLDEREWDEQAARHVRSLIDAEE